jgi:hypothetical protein
MTLRSAIRSSRILTFGIIFVMLWGLLNLYRVATSFNWEALAAPSFIGLNAVGGIAGVVVLAVFLMLLIGLYGELGESDPAPEPWPPTE